MFAGISETLLKRGSLLITFVFLVLLVQPVTAFGDEIEDVPETHWAYESVQKLVDEGYMALYADETFRGEEPVDRYTLATVIAKILSEIEAGVVTPDDEDMDLLRELSTEFRDELVEVAGETEVLSERIDRLEEEDKILQTRQAKITDEFSSMQEEVQAILSEIRTEAEEREDFEPRLDTLEAQIEAIEREAVEIDSEALEERDRETDERLRTLERQLDSLRREVATLQDRPAEPLRGDTNLPLYALGAALVILLLSQ